MQQLLNLHVVDACSREQQTWDDDLQYPTSIKYAPILNPIQSIAQWPGWYLHQASNLQIPN